MRPLARAWTRLFLMQAAWNYERMVGQGLAFAAEPLLATLPGGRRGMPYAAALGRAAAYFNAHPYFAGIAVGAEARAEHQGVAPEDIVRLRRALVGPLGSLGDQVIWAGLLPAALGVGLVLMAVAGPWWGVGGFLVLYNAPHFWVRSWALRAGWRLGRRVAESLAQPRMRRALVLAGPSAAFALGLAFPVVAKALINEFPIEAKLVAAAVAGLGVVLGRWVWPGLGGLRYGLALAVLASAAGWLWR